MDLTAVMLALIDKSENIAMVVLVLMLCGCGYLHLVWRAEDRKDRQNMLDAFKANTDALHRVANAISARTGSPFDGT